MPTSQSPVTFLFTSFRGKLILIFAVLTIGCIAASTEYTHYLQNEFVLMRAQDLATEDLRLISSEIQSVLQWVIRDLYVLRDLPHLTEYLAHESIEDNASDLSTIREAFQVLAIHHQLYHQIRYIDASGMEIIRINYDGHESRLVPQSQLQNKKHRYYFMESMKLQKGQIYVSRFDLNIEHGDIETPHVPTIRYATPVVDQSGNKLGIIVCNILGSTLLNILDRQQKQLHHHGKKYYLIDARGYYLYHPQQSKTFGFMFKKNIHLQRDEPHLMKAIGLKDHGALVGKSSLTEENTLFAYRRLPLVGSNLDHFQYSLGETAHTASNSAEADAYLTLISTQRESDLFVGLSVYRKPFLIFTLVLLSGSILLSVFVGLSVVRPVVSLASAARRIQKGDLSARAKIYSDDEMGRLGKIFNSMAEQLKESVDQLRASVAKYRAIFENSRDCIFVADAENCIIDLNPTGSNLLGIPSVPGHRTSVKFPWADEGSNVLKIFHSLMIEEGFVKNYQVKIKRKDGTIRECLMTATARWNQKAEFIGYEGALRDITDRLNRHRAERQFQKRLQDEIIMAEERARHALGQVLHEELAQNMVLAHLKIEEARAGLPPGDKLIRYDLDYILKLLEQMIHQIRTTVFDLYPAMMDSQGLIPTMRWYAQIFTKRTSIPVTIYELRPCSRLAKPQEVYLFRAYKELLHNVLKHAQAQEIVVTLVEKNGTLRLLVDDDGRGFNPELAFDAPQQITGIGLFTIREWSDSMNGRLSVESWDGRGTRVLIEIPVNNGCGGIHD